MDRESLRKKETPWVTLVLVLMVFACQVLVLTGNMKTASAMSELGKSTGGWSRVGLGVGKSLREELDYKMNNVSLQFLDAVKHVGVVQQALDGLLSLVGGATDSAVSNSKELSAFQEGGKAGLHSLLQERRLARNSEQQGEGSDFQVSPQEVSLLALEAHVSRNESNDTNILKALTPLIMSSVHDVLNTTFSEVLHELDVLLAKIKPALLQVGKWILKFGSKIQAGIDDFSATLDTVQKLFDQVMSEMSGGPGNESQMLNETFSLFDVETDGLISVKDLHDVANLYSITALQGKLSEKLVHKYDTSGDMTLDKHEMLQFVNDPSIPKSMATILRTYARRLAEASGQVSAARQRNEVAEAVVHYIQLVCAKNMTKVGWVADRLGNNSLPLEFTADIMVELCLEEDKVGALTAESVGDVLVGEIYNLHPNTTHRALGLLSNTTYWVSEGFDLQDQPVCLKRITGWVTSAEQARKSSKGGNSSAQLLAIAEALRLGAEAAPQGSKPEAFEALPLAAERAAKERAAMYLLQVQRARRAAADSADHQASSARLHLQQTLLGGSLAIAAAGGDQEQSGASQAIKQGVLARPETLEFARFLANNASSTAKYQQQLCFDYSHTSSNAVDSFASQIQSFVSMTQSFLDMMMKYATPAGIEGLENTIKDFAEKGVQDVTKVLEKRLVKLLNNSGPLFEHAVHEAAQKAGKEISAKIGEMIATPIGEAMAPVVKDMLHSLDNSSSSASEALSESLGKELGREIANLTSKALTAEAGSIVEDLVDQALTKGVQAASGAVEHLTGHSHQEASSAATPAAAAGQPSGVFTEQYSVTQSIEAFQWDDDEQVLAMLQADRERDNPVEAIEKRLSGSWESLVNTLHSLVNTVPTAVSSLKFARKEVSKLYSNLDSIFEVFEHKGVAVFDDIAFVWRTLWAAYFCFLVPLDICLLLYAFWSGGYLGGPQPLNEEDLAAGYQPPSTWRERFSCCYRSCCSCVTRTHDSSACFWMLILFLQLLVMLVFLVSIALCILAGVKAFIIKGCEEVYILGDQTICSESLGNLRNFLDTFLVSGPIGLEETCSEEFLLTCNLIHTKMMTSTILTTVFSMLGALIGLQFVIDVAILHERVIWRRKAEELYRKEAAGAGAASGGTEGSQR